MHGRAQKLASLPLLEARMMLSRVIARSPEMPARPQPPAATQTPPLSSPAFLRVRSVMSWTGLPRSTLYALIKKDSFPRPVKLGKRIVGWRLEDLELWRADRH